MCLYQFQNIFLLFHVCSLCPLFMLQRGGGLLFSFFGIKRVSTSWTVGWFVLGRLQDVLLWCVSLIWGQLERAAGSMQAACRASSELPTVPTTRSLTVMLVCVRLCLLTPMDSTILLYNHWTADSSEEKATEEKFKMKSLNDRQSRTRLKISLSVCESVLMF